MWARALENDGSSVGSMSVLDVCIVIFLDVRFFSKKRPSHTGVSNCSRWCVRRRFSKAWVAPGIRGPNCLASIGCVSAWLVEANLLGECLRTG